MSRGFCNVVNSLKKKNSIPYLNGHPVLTLHKADSSESRTLSARTRGMVVKVVTKCHDHKQRKFSAFASRRSNRFQSEKINRALNDIVILICLVYYFVGMQSSLVLFV